LLLVELLCVVLNTVNGHDRGFVVFAHTSSF
jgi:hypothetical protein